MRRCLILFLFAVACVVIAPAATLVVVSSPPGDVVQQTAANPCFYGGSNCQLPAGWNSLEAVTGEGNDTFSGSITYLLTSSPYLDVFSGGAFVIGIDVNDTNNDPQVLESLVVHFNIGEDYQFTGPLSLPNSANGVGYSDFIMQAQGGGPLLVPVGATSVTFSLSLSNLNDGPDRFFIIPDQQDDPVVPEPATFALLGTALVGIGAARKLRKNTV